MKTQTFHDLGDLRVRLLGFRDRFVADRLAIPLERLQAIESGAAEPSVTEIELLAEFYGIDEERLEDEPIVIIKGEGVELLALNQELPVDDAGKARVVRAANAARDLVALEAMADCPARLELLKTNRIAPPVRARDEQPYKTGANWGRSARKHLGLHAPIASMRDLVHDHWPALRVLYADLGSKTGVAGLTFVDATRGPTIVLNLRGRNEHPLVRRFSLAHELGHVLIDLQRGQPLALLSTYKTGAHLDVEARANAFAMRLLCPEQVARRIAREQTSEGAVRILINRWGVHYAAARLYLRNVANVTDLPPQMPTGMLEDSASLKARQRWAQAERPDLLADFPIAEVPPERRTMIAKLASRLHAEGTISRGRLCEYLRVSRAADVERIADFFGYDLE